MLKKKNDPWWKTYQWHFLPRWAVNLKLGKQNHLGNLVTLLPLLETTRIKIQIERMSCEKIYNYTTMVFFWRQAFWSWSHSGFNSGINCSKRSSTISISRQSLPPLNPRSVLFSLYHVSLSKICQIFIYLQDSLTQDLSLKKRQASWGWWLCHL